MTVTVPAPTTTMRPYRQRGEIDYARLDYNPDEPVLKPEAMEQEQPMQELLGLLASRFTDFGQRPDTFLSSNTIICYDPRDLNVRVSPDGILKGYSEVLGLSLCWDAGWPRLYDPAEAAYLENWQQVWVAREVAELRANEAEFRVTAAETRAAAERDRRQAAESELQRLREQLRRRQADR